MRRFVLPLLILGSGFALAAILIATGPTIEPQAVRYPAPLVKVINVEPRSVQLSTFTHGTVVPRTESQLVPEVSGRVLSVSESMVSGGFFSEGDLLISIDPLDYEVAVEQSRAGIARAVSDLSNARTAHARQLDLARRQSTSASQRDDALNRLRIAEATYREAKAKLQRAERDTERTKIIAPFDGRVRSERVDIGQFVNRGTSVATIYATDYAEVRLPIHDEELEFLDLPFMFAKEEQPVDIQVTLRARFGGHEREWQGKVVRTEGELDPRTRMLYVIASVPAPYHKNGDRPPLSVGLFVEAEIYGSHFDDIVVLPRAALRGEKQVYIVDTENILRFREIEILRITADEVYVKAGLSRGERVCTSPLESPIDGMTVRVQNEPDSKQIVGS